jgi:hypothetical protein
MPSDQSLVFVTRGVAARSRREETIVEEKSVSVSEKPTGHRVFWIASFGVCGTLEGKRVRRDSKRLCQQIDEII